MVLSSNKVASQTDHLPPKASKAGHLSPAMAPHPVPCPLQIHRVHATARNQATTLANQPTSSTAHPRPKSHPRASPRKWRPPIPTTESARAMKKWKTRRRVRLDRRFAHQLWASDAVTCAIPAATRREPSARRESASCSERARIGLPWSLFAVTNIMERK
jgi:hypothetical protein